MRRKARDALQDAWKSTATVNIVPPTIWEGPGQMMTRQIELLQQYAYYLSSSFFLLLPPSLDGHAVIFFLASSFLTRNYTARNQLRHLLSLFFFLWASEWMIICHFNPLQTTTSFTLYLHVCNDTTHESAERRWENDLVHLQHSVQDCSAQ